MIVWSDSVRKRDPGFFCRLSIQKSTVSLFASHGSYWLIFTFDWNRSTGSKPVVIVSDIRRKTDIKFFRNEGYNIKSIRINTDEEVRKSRGWVFQSGVDDVQSECDLDDFTPWDLIIDNDGNQDPEAIVDQILALASWFMQMNDSYMLTLFLTSVMVVIKTVYLN